MKAFVTFRAGKGMEKAVEFISKTTFCLFIIIRCTTVWIKSEDAKKFERIVQLQVGLQRSIYRTGHGEDFQHQAPNIHLKRSRKFPWIWRLNIHFTLTFFRHLDKSKLVTQILYIDISSPSHQFKSQNRSTSKSRLRCVLELYFGVILSYQVMIVEWSHHGGNSCQRVSVNNVDHNWISQISF